ncbi:MAG TPA: 4a-hydroxytetrahydrobiopterin dehydratase [Flavobacteriaceae bacterium]|nr:4a-hydroxytetrahydrobiopterin dehydratase [Flavobacteriaceae bacterium]
MERLSNQEIAKKIALHKNWEFRDNAIMTSFKLKDFKEVFSKMTQIAFEAEIMQHHPNWTNSYNQLSISLTTHDVNGVSQKDFDLAEAIDKIMKNG